MPKVNSQKGNITLILGQIVLLALTGFLVILWFTGEIKAETAIYSASWGIILCAVYAVFSWWRLTGKIFDPYLIFYACAVAFNGGHAFLRILGVEVEEVVNSSSEFYILRYHSQDVIAKSYLCVLMALVCFHLGALVSGKLNNVVGQKKFSETEHGELRNTALRVVGWGMIVLSFVPTLMVLYNSFRMSLTGSYIAYLRRQAAYGLAAWAWRGSDFFLPGCLFLMAGGSQKKFSRRISVLILLIYCLGFLMVGSRHKALFPLIAGVWVWHKTVRPIPKYLVAIGGFLLVFVICPFIKAVRETPLLEYNSIREYIGAFFSIGNPIVRILFEMGQTVGTVQHTIELVPGEGGFSWGKEYLYGLFTVVPNLFWPVHPWESVDPADWLVQAIAPWHASLGMGFGYSFIAEAYLNFGLLGITLGMAVIGFFVGKLCSLVNYNRDPAQIAALGSAVAFSFFWARGTAGDLVRPFIWQGLLPYLLVVFLIKLGGEATSFSDKSKRLREK